MINEEYRHTSLIATLREQWDLGDPFTARDAAARTFSNVFTLDTPRDPKTWPVPKARPVPPMQQDVAGLGAVLSVMGKTMLQGIREYAAEHNLEIEGLPKDPKAAYPRRPSGQRHAEGSSRTGSRCSRASDYGTANGAH